MTTTKLRHGATPTAQRADQEANLPLSPWRALRPATGMLLDGDDFDVIMGNPRAKHMLHNAWAHGSGVVWGLFVTPHGEWDLEISPGLAIDGLGRELHLDEPRCISFRHMLDDGHYSVTPAPVDLSLVLSFEACADRPVPALADPCDVTRETQEYSRVGERARLGFVAGHHPSSRGYHRVRVLLGLDRPGTGDEAGAEALAARTEVLAAPATERPAALLRWFGCLAARDASDRAPAGRDCEHDLFPVADTDAGIVLGCLRLMVRDESGTPDLTKVTIDDCCRTTVVPTTVIQDLLCALAPGLIGAGTSAGPAPQVVPDIDWNLDSKELSFTVTADLLPATLTHETVKVSSLSEGGWQLETLGPTPRYDAEKNRVVVGLTLPPRGALVRVVVVGTGPTPVYGADPRVPLAGVDGDDPGGQGQGRDAVLTDENPWRQDTEQYKGVETR